MFTCYFYIHAQDFACISSIWFREISCSRRQLEKFDKISIANTSTPYIAFTNASIWISLHHIDAIFFLLAFTHHRSSDIVRLFFFFFHVAASQRDRWWWATANLFLPRDFPSWFRYFQIGGHCTRLFCTVSSFVFLPRFTGSHGDAETSNQRPRLDDLTEQVASLGGSVSIYEPGGSYRRGGGSSDFGRWTCARTMLEISHWDIDMRGIINPIRHATPVGERTRE